MSAASPVPFAGIALHNQSTSVKPARHLGLIPAEFGERVVPAIGVKRNQRDSLG
jgi:hypothetical protein